MNEDEIAETLRGIHQRHARLQDRVAAVSEAFLGTPYRLGPLGEGPDGDFDRDPLYSFKELDCTTFVEEVMALSLESDLDRAKLLLQKIRYRNGVVSFADRNHFPEADWLPNNQAAGFLRDITREIAGGRTRIARKRISKRAWYASRTLADVAGFSHDSAAQSESRLQDLHKAGELYADEISTVAYLPLEALPAALDRIPSGAVANLVREDQPDKPVLITHQLFIVVKDGRRWVRHAASGRAVEEQPALDYFSRCSNSAWRVKGVNLNEIIVPPALTAPPK